MQTWGTRGCRRERRKSASWFCCTVLGWNRCFLPARGRKAGCELAAKPRSTQNQFRHKTEASGCQTFPFSFLPFCSAAGKHCAACFPMTSCPNLSLSLSLSSPRAKLMEKPFPSRIRGKTRGSPWATPHLPVLPGA